MDEMYSIWGRRVLAARERLGLTQGQLAASARLGQATVSRIENGKGCPSDGAKYRLAYALGERPSDLFPWLPVPAELADQMRRETEAAA